MYTTRLDKMQLESCTRRGSSCILGRCARHACTVATQTGRFHPKAGMKRPSTVIKSQIPVPKDGRRPPSAAEGISVSVERAERALANESAPSAGAWADLFASAPSARSALTEMPSPADGGRRPSFGSGCWDTSSQGRKVSFQLWDELSESSQHLSRLATTMYGHGNKNRQCCSPYIFSSLLTRNR